MKKIYLLFLGLIISFSASAQLDFDFEIFVPGDVVGQVPEIVLWPAAGVTSSQVTTEQAFSGSQSVVTRENDGTIIDDILINCGNVTSGVYSISWKMYVPAGKTGFWNIQDDETFTSTAEAQWNGQFFIGATASGGTAGQVTFDQDPNVGVPYPEDTWFDVIHVVDLDAGTHTLSIDGTLLLDAFPYADTSGNPADRVGAINYYAIDGDNRYYVDDFKLEAGDILSTNDLEGNNFAVYPNPVQDVMNIRSNEVVDNVQVYDVLGKLVMEVAPNAVSPTVNMSELTSGAYFVRVSINGSAKTVKVIK